MGTPHRATHGGPITPRGATMHGNAGLGRQGGWGPLARVPCTAPGRSRAAAGHAARSRRVQVHADWEPVHAARDVPHCQQVAALREAHGLEARVRHGKRELPPRAAAPHAHRAVLRAGAGGGAGGWVGGGAGGAWVEARVGAWVGARARACACVHACKHVCACAPP